MSLIVNGLKMIMRLTLTTSRWPYLAALWRRQFMAVSASMSGWIPSLRSDSSNILQKMSVLPFLKATRRDSFLPMTTLVLAAAAIIAAMAQSKRRRRQ